MSQHNAWMIYAISETWFQKRAFVWLNQISCCQVLWPWLRVTCRPVLCEPTEGSTAGVTIDLGSSECRRHGGAGFRSATRLLKSRGCLIQVLARDMWMVHSPKATDTLIQRENSSFPRYFPSLSYSRPSLTCLLLSVHYWLMNSFKWTRRLRDHLASLSSHSEAHHSEHPLPHTLMKAHPKFDHDG
jgi:hypothetical protein